MKKVKVDPRFDGVHIDTEKPVKMIAKNAVCFRSNVMGNMGGHVEFNTLISPEYNQAFGCFIGKLIGGEEVRVFTGNLLTASMVNLYAASAYKQENPYSPKKDIKKMVVFSLPTNYEFDGFSDKDGVMPLCVGSLDKE